MKPHHKLILEKAGWTLLYEKPYEDHWVYAMHKATGQIVFVQFSDDQDDPVSKSFQIIEALTTKQVIDRKEVFR